MEDEILEEYGDRVKVMLMIVVIIVFMICLIIADFVIETIENPRL